jgi:hypothetical protein
VASLLACNAHPARLNGVSGRCESRERRDGGRHGTVPRRASPSVAVPSDHEPPRTARTEKGLSLLKSLLTKPLLKATYHAKLGLPGPIIVDDQ